MAKQTTVSPTICVPGYNVTAAETAELAGQANDYVRPWNVKLSVAHIEHMFPIASQHETPHSVSIGDVAAQAMAAARPARRTTLRRPTRRNTCHLTSPGCGAGSARRRGAVMGRAAVSATVSGNGAGARLGSKISRLNTVLARRRRCQQQQQQQPEKAVEHEGIDTSSSACTTPP